MSNEHKLKTISDIFEVVNEDNLKNFLQDFEFYLKFRLEILKINSVFNEFDIEANFDYFHWIDDGNHDHKINVNYKF